MSLGQTYSNNNEKKDNSITVYSIRFNNPNSQVDQTCLTVRFWNNSIVISIFPKKNTGNDNVTYDMDSGISIYLSSAKAFILKQEIENFMKDPVNYNGVGVSNAAGNAVISISNGVEYGKNTPIITIRKVSETSEVLASFAYEIKTNDYFAIREYNGQKPVQYFDDYRNLELIQICTVLDEFCKAITNAVAFTVVNQSRYMYTRVEDRLHSIMSKMGIEIPSSSRGNGNRNYGNGYFNNLGTGNSSNGNGYSSSSNVSYGSATIDDLE